MSLCRPSVRYGKRSTIARMLLIGRPGRPTRTARLAGALATAHGVTEVNRPDPLRSPGAGWQRALLAAASRSPGADTGPGARRIGGHMASSGVFKFRLNTNSGPHNLDRFGLNGA
jgi:hypothetical protein